MTISHRVTAGMPEPLGLTLDRDGANIAVFSERAEEIAICLFDPDGREVATYALPERTGDVHHGHISGIRDGEAYGLRAKGPFAPKKGLRFNPAKLLLDPYARALSGPLQWSERQVGHDPTDPNRPDPRDSAPTVAKCIARADPPPIDPAERPATPWPATIIYEAHVKALTRLWPGLPESLRGTVEALGHPQVVAHLTSLGITAIELMPIQAFATERHLAERGLTNHWGYNTAAFFAPEPRYLGPNGLDGLRAAVRTLHRAGIEAILDVVYNHSAESDVNGPTLSFRGLDNAAYYRLSSDPPHDYLNDTGCGNTLDLSHPAMQRLAIDSLRWWAERIGVDGFRFDLAPALARGPEGFDRGSGFFDAVRADPVLGTLKLIAEPWDIGPDGYRLGQFPAPVAEWNDRFRDDARAFWLGQPGAAGALADGLLGSARVFDADARAPWASINFAACHDGFTLRDLTQYSTRHNHANGEDNRDGHGHNLSANFGVEGPSDDPVIEAARALRQRNLLATVFLAQGTPMLLAGDEIGHSQGGNNNAYCQDNETTWIDWARGDAGLRSFCSRLMAFRKRIGALGQDRFLHGEPVAPGGPANVAWFGPGGGPVDWDCAHQTGFAFCLAMPGKADWVLVALNPGEDAWALPLPPVPDRLWTCEIDTQNPDAASVPVEDVARIAAQSVRAFVASVREART